MKLFPHYIIRRNSAVFFTPLDNEFLAFDESAGYLYGMNETASRVWQLIERPRAVMNICESLCQEFVVDEARCVQEVLVLMQYLQAAGLVQVEKPEEGSKG